MPRERLQANDYNPNHVPPLELRLLKVSILESGWTQPIVVAADGRTIVDGFHRWMVSADPAVAALTGGLVPIVRCAHRAAEARMAATVRHNRARGEHAVRPLIAVVQRLRARLPVEEVMRRLGMQREEVERLSSLRASPGLHADPAGSYSEAWTPEGPEPTPGTGNGRRRRS